MSNFQEKSNYIWNLADLLRGSFKRNEYQKVILPFTVLKRFDSVLEYSKQDVLDNYNQYKDKIDNIEPFLKTVAIDENGNELGFYNLSKYDFKSLLEDQENIEKNMIDYLDCFSDDIKDIFEMLDFKRQILRLSKDNLLFALVKEFYENVDLTPESLSNHEMGFIFDELIKKFAESSNEEAGEHYTPKDIVKLMTELMFIDDKDIEEEYLIKKIYDPACGTGGMLNSCKDFITQNNKDIDVVLYGQEIYSEIYAICKADMLIKGEVAQNIKGPSSTLSDDQFKDEKFDYIISNIPYGRSWELDKEAVAAEAELGYTGRFGAGTPRINDGQLLFLQHMISKMKTKEKSRIVVITNGSPLFAGDAGSGESEIRRWIFENDYLEALVALPDKLFFNTGISTYVWVMTNQKSDERKGKVQLVDGREEFVKLRKSIGNKQNKISDESIKNIIKLYESYEESDKVKICDNKDFGYTKIVLERPMQLNYQVTEERLLRIDSSSEFRGLAESKSKDLEVKNEEIGKGILLQEYIKDALRTIPNKKYIRWHDFESQVKNVLSPFNLKPSFIKGVIIKLSEHDDNAEYVTDINGNLIPNINLREYKKIPLNQNIQEYCKRNILPYYKDAWIDEDNSKIGYEINFKNLIFDAKLYFDGIDYPIVCLDELITLKRTFPPKEECELYIRYNGYFKKALFFPNEISEGKEFHYKIGCNIKSNKLTKDYLYHFINSKKGLELFSYFQKTHIAHIEDIYNIPIPLPDIKTQNEIVETYRLIDGFFNDINFWRDNYLNNILDYEPALETYKDFSCNINFADDGGVSEFCHNWRIVYQGLIWPLAYTYLRATKGSKEESTTKNNLLVLFEFLAAFNVIVLISGINNGKLEHNEFKEIKEELWKLYKNDPTTWHRIAFGSWTTLYKRLRKAYRDYNISTPLDNEFFNRLSSKKYEKLFNKLRSKERNPDAHGGFEDDIDVEAKVDDLKTYVNTDIFEILRIYSGLKLYYFQGESKRISPKKVEHKMLSLNGPCDPGYWPRRIYKKELDPYCLYLYDSVNNSYLKLDNDLIKFRLIPDSKQYGIYIYDGIDKGKNVAKYKCYQRKNEIWEVDLITDEDTYFKVSEEFLKDVLRL